VTLCEQYPETGEESVPAAEGAAAHWAASEVLESFTQGGESGLILAASLVGRVAPNGVIVSEEMIDAVEHYVRDVLAEAQTRGTLSGTFVERHVFIHSVHPENEGTFDSAVFMQDATEGAFIIWDFKYGWGIVEPHGNWQLIDYAIGLLAEWEERGIPLPHTIELRIVQPRPHHPMGMIRSWKATPTELYSYYEALHASANEALGPNPRYVPGVPQCTHCSGRTNCTALNRAVYNIQEFVDYAPPAEMSGEVLGARVYQLRQYSKLLDALSSGVEERAIAQIRGGEVVHGWDAKLGNGRTKWKPGTGEQVLSLGDLLSVELRKPVELITPKQAEKAGIDKAVISAYSETPTTGMKLVPMDAQKVAQLFNK
tara:strand:+ start:273 stop:1382 length:1110 start_codon:yes stop_codon:yes gene_type:complete